MDCINTATRARVRQNAGRRGEQVTAACWLPSEKWGQAEVVLMWSHNAGEGDAHMAITRRTMQLTSVGEGEC